MGKKGKGKGNKLAKMSEEERARYLQMRADMEEETRRRKMQLISMYMKVTHHEFAVNQNQNPDGMTFPIKIEQTEKRGCFWPTQYG